MYDDDDDLPPDHMPVGELIAWLRLRLVRPPTLEDLAAIRFAQAKRARRRSGKQRIRWPSKRGDGEPLPDSIVREVLAGPEMQPFWTAAAWLVGSLSSRAMARPHDAWLTQPETVLRLAAEVPRLAAALPREVKFGPSLRAETEDLLSYLNWKLGGGAGLAEGWNLDRRLIALTNVVLPEEAELMARALEGVTEVDRRGLLARYRRAGADALQSWPGAGRVASGPPLGLLVPPPDEPEAEPRPEGGGAPAAGPRPSTHLGGRR
ncbi:hypothetical protein SAMN02982917_1871 [Azospirillum oryzae]|uniref:Uncharacterized protein n=1 Tax=Azospirillum oryzae TaxID=286727 RepID=A0A1X7EMH6_9PROT|nr:hypothetical protein [Azospirillum oryzae]SMF36653.1 hypothetical protein SAMN02982917_1871 [Azospirillum oryzae]